MVTLRVGAASDRGRVREHNEDRMMSGTALFVVADGMGGHAAGEVASSIVIDRMRALDERRDLAPEDVRVALCRANRDILRRMRRNPRYAGMGTTVTGICLARLDGGTKWMVFNVGDSRVYRYAGGALSQVTVDHSEVGEMVAAGTLSREAARHHPRRNVVTRALGMDPPPDLDVWMLPPTAGERYLVCSDGLSQEMADADIAGVLRAEPVAAAAAEVLLRTALDAGGRDNITVIVIDHLVGGSAGDADDTVGGPGDAEHARTPGRTHTTGGPP
jgi:serine/threonine protein phosphatase PrpC